jgi:hypothetical protein
MISREKRTYIRELIGGCPIDKVCDDCPFAMVRGKAIYERIDWVDRLNTEAAENMIARHKCCLARGEEFIRM